MLLAVDIGNTNIVFGLFKEGQLQMHWRIRTERNRTTDEYWVLVQEFIRLNSADPEIIDALYEASMAGVRIDLIVRGVCALRPGFEGISDNIRVRSIVGRFLEHSRVFWFHHGGAEKVLIGSADWMPRNLYRRVECLVPVEAAALARRVVDEALTPYLTDDRDSWELGPDGTYTPSPPGGTRSAQQALLAELTREHEGF